jgi:ubiquinone/menaquinone biosynthesis C-methylase UbiE
VAEKAKLQAGDKVLDVSTGTGLTGLEALALQPDAYVVGTDLTNAMLKQAQKNISGYEKQVSFVNGDMEILPYASNSFDVILSCYGIGGIENREKAFEEMVRVAKPEARIAIVEMAAPPQKMYAKRIIHKFFTQPLIRTLWGFRDTDLIDLSKKHGIKMEGTEYLGEMVLGSSRLVYGTVQK